MIASHRLRLVALGALLSAGCSSSVNGSGGAGGSGGSGGEAPCTFAPSDAQTPGPLVEVAPALGLSEASWGVRPAVASNGVVSLAVWKSEGFAYTRLSATGEALDVPARPIEGDSNGDRPVLLWDGTHFVMLAVMFAGDSTVVRRLLIDDAGDIVPGSELNIEGLEGMTTVSAATNGSETMIVGSNWTPSGVVAAAVRLDSVGSPLDAAPIELPGNYVGDVLWDGTSFVVMQYAEDTYESLAVRVSPAGEVLDPAPVPLAPLAVGAAIAEPNGSVVAWLDETQALQVARFSPTLDVVEGPVLVKQFELEKSSVEGLSLSRSSGGQLVIGYTIVDDTSTGTMVAYALADDLSLLGTSVYEEYTYDEVQAFAGLSGLDHLVVRAGDPLTAERLTGSASGLVGSGPESIAIAGGAQGAVAAAGSPSGYLTVWEETDASGSTLRAVRLGLDGNPAGEPMELGAVAHGIAAHVAWSGERYFVVWTAADGSLQFSEVMPGADVADTSASLSAGYVITSGVACVGGRCLVSWLEDSRTEVRGQMFDDNGGAGTPFTIADVSWGDADRIAVQPLAGDLAAFWATGAARIDASGSAVAQAGFPGTSIPSGVGGGDSGGPSTDGVGMPLAAGPTTLLAYLVDGSAPTTGWVELLNLDGSSAGHVDLTLLASPPAATWDGAGYLFNYGDRTLSIAPDGSVLGPVDGFETEALSDPAFASAGPGRALRVGVKLDPATGSSAIVAQSFDRPGCN